MARPPVELQLIESPYRGLSAFAEEHAESYFGRDKECLELRNRVQSETLTVLFGKSGLGKTSLLFAGLFPVLRRKGFLPIYIRIAFREKAPPPISQIAERIRQEYRSYLGIDLPEELSPWELLHETRKRFAADGQVWLPVLVLDQFEELFTLGGHESSHGRQAEFVTGLADIVENRVPASIESRFEDCPELIETLDFGGAKYRVVLSLREDFLPHLEELRSMMPSVVMNRIRLGQLSGEEALKAVVLPSKGLVSAEVGEAIVRFTAAGAVQAFAPSQAGPSRLAALLVEPALLSLLCSELDERRRRLGLDRISHELLGGSATSILLEYYERCIEDQPGGLRDFIEEELLTAQGFRENLSIERASVEMSERGLAPASLHLLIDRRLLRCEETSGARRIEIVHDLLAEVIRGQRDIRTARTARSRRLSTNLAKVCVWAGAAISFLVLLAFCAKSPVIESLHFGPLALVGLYLGIPVGVLTHRWRPLPGIALWALVLGLPILCCVLYGGALEELCSPHSSAPLQELAARSFTLGDPWHFDPATGVHRLAKNTELSLASELRRVTPWSLGFLSAGVACLGTALMKRRLRAGPARTLLMPCIFLFLACSAFFLLSVTARLILGGEPHIGLRSLGWILALGSFGSGLGFWGMSRARRRTRSRVARWALMTLPLLGFLCAPATLLALLFGCKQLLGFRFSDSSHASVLDLAIGACVTGVLIVSELRKSSAPELRTSLRRCAVALLLTVLILFAVLPACANLLFKSAYRQYIEFWRDRGVKAPQLEPRERTENASASAITSKLAKMGIPLHFYIGGRPTQVQLSQGHMEILDAAWKPPGVFRRPTAPPGGSGPSSSLSKLSSSPQSVEPTEDLEPPAIPDSHADTSSPALVTSASIEPPAIPGSQEGASSPALATPAPIEPTDSLADTRSLEIARNYQNEEIATVLRALSAEAGLQAIVWPSVSGTITVKAERCSAKEMIETIAQKYDLRVYEADQTTVFLKSTDPDPIPERRALRERIFENEDLRAVLQSLAAEAGISLDLSKKIHGVVTARIGNATALDAIKQITSQQKLHLSTVESPFDESVKRATISPDEAPIMAAPIAYEFQGDDLSSVLRYLARLARVNMVISENVEGRVTLRVEEHTPLELIELITEAKNLRLDERDSILYVKTQAEPAINEPVTIVPLDLRLDEFYNFLLSKDSPRWSRRFTDGNWQLVNLSSIRLLVEIVAVDALRKFDKGDEVGAWRAIEAGLHICASLRDSDVLLEKSAYEVLRIELMKVAAQAPKASSTFRNSLCVSFSERKRSLESCLATNPRYLARDPMAILGSPSDAIESAPAAVTGIRVHSTLRFVADPIIKSWFCYSRVTWGKQYAELWSQPSAPPMNSRRSTGDLFQAQNLVATAIAAALLQEQTSALLSAKESLKNGKSGDLGAWPSECIQGSVWRAYVAPERSTAIVIELKPMPDWMKQDVFLNPLLMRPDGSEVWDRVSPLSTLPKAPKPTAPEGK